jgi:hypothetical protein
MRVTHQCGNDGGREEQVPRAVPQRRGPGRPALQRCFLIRLAGAVVGLPEPLGILAAVLALEGARKVQRLTQRRHALLHPLLRGRHAEPLQQ